MQNYSVLMSVYFKESPEYLKQAIESIQAQTVPTDDFVLVCDGPLNDAFRCSNCRKTTGDGFGFECCSSCKERWTWQELNKGSNIAKTNWLRGGQ